jgi:hypothetical protein
LSLQRDNSGLSAIRKLWLQENPRIPKGAAAAKQFTQELPGTLAKEDYVKSEQVFWNVNGGDDGTRTRDLCRDRLGGFGFSVTYILAGLPSR